MNLSHADSRANLKGVNMANGKDLTEMSIQELQDLITAARTQLNKLVQSKRQELQKLLSELDEISGSEAPPLPLRRAGATPKYRSQKNPEREWAGRGNVPKWLEYEMKETGKELYEFKI